MSTTFNGSCLCGAVAFRVCGEFESFFVCHCKRCRKGTGSTYAANLFSTSATIEWLKGDDQHRSYRLPDTQHERGFCANCGSALPTVDVNGPLLLVPAGSLDSPIDIHPKAHIYYADRADWEDGLAAAQKLDGLPD